MLPETIKPIGFDSLNKEDWERYRNRLQLNDPAICQFYRQVVYDHFDHFNEYYPDFMLDDYIYEIKSVSAQFIRDSIRFFRGDALDDWGLQYDEFEKKNQDYIIFQTMSKSRTFPFPPIIIDPSQLGGTGWRECGRPLHLIEGTHRVSYLRRMLERNLVAAESIHQVVLLSPKSTIVRFSFPMHE